MWHVGEKYVFGIFADYVIEIQADGDELEYIKNNFTNIPYSNKRVVNWKGDIAKFIVRNLWLDSMI